MNQLALEAGVIGIKEAVKLALCLFLVTGYLRGVERHGQVRVVLAAVAAVLAASLAVSMVPVTAGARSFAVKAAGYVFGLIYLFSIAALYQSTGTKIPDPLAGLLRRNAFLGPLLFFAAIIYLVPDMVASSLFVSDLQEMAGGSMAIRATAAAGFCAALIAAYAVGRKIRVDVLRIAALPQLLLTLALVKLVSGGVSGFAEFSLIPAVQSGLMKLTHDLVHHLLVMLMVPDHPVLTVTAWNFIALLFSDAAGLWLSLVIFVLPLALFLKKHFAAAVSLPAGLDTGAGRRSFRKAVRNDRLLKAAPIVLFMAVISITWFSQRGESSSQRYNPEPVRLVAEGETLVIPIQSPGRDLLDGSIHKFLVQGAGADIRILIVKKPDGTLAICLDACDICPPEGYVQVRDQVICTYCNTPIPLGTVGKAGGCNPVPVHALITDKDVRVAMQEIIEKWKAMKSGAGKEGVGK